MGVQLFLGGLAAWGGKKLVPGQERSAIHWIGMRRKFWGSVIKISGNIMMQQCEKKGVTLDGKRRDASWPKIVWTRWNSWLIPFELDDAFFWLISRKIGIITITLGANIISKPYCHNKNSKGGLQTIEWYRHLVSSLWWCHRKNYRWYQALKLIACDDSFDQSFWTRSRITCVVDRIWIP